VKTGDDPSLHASCPRCSVCVCVCVSVIVVKSHYFITHGMSEVLFMSVVVAWISIAALSFSLLLLTSWIL